MPLLTGLLMTVGCATTTYTPRVVARGELTLRYQGGFEMWGGGKQVAHSLLWSGLPEYVRCVPEAHEQAMAAANSGRAAVTLSILGGTLGALAVGGLIGASVDYAPDSHLAAWLGGGVGVATLGTVAAGLGRLFKNRANGHAVDAMNLYNDRVGSLGASCDDLSYPQPAGP
jgi:hypothetical protein